jgi:zinc transport system ATP-binding protein
MSAVHLKNIFFSYDSNVILKDSSADIDHNTFTGIIGPNGCGKTTLLKLILGLLKPNKGQIKILGKSPKDVLGKLGYVPQMANMDRDFPISTLELVMMGDTKTKIKELKDKAINLLEIIGLKELMNSPIKYLSGGQFQRALIARSLIADPQLLVLDEPTANIDTKSEEKIIDLLLRFKKYGTILMVSHNLDVISKAADEVLLVQNNITTLPVDKICGHFALGLYHKLKDTI